MPDEQEIESVEETDAVETTEQEQEETVEQEEPVEKDEAEEDVAQEEPAEDKPSAKAKGPDYASELAAERKEKEKLIAERAAYQAQLENIRERERVQQSDADRRAEADRLALLDPAERAAYHAEQKANNLERRLNMLQMQMHDNGDKATFSAKAAHDPLYAKHMDEVEAMFQDGLSKGVRSSREDLLAYTIGREALKNRPADAAKKKSSAGKRIDSVTSKPATARGDVAGSKKGKSLEDRLAGVQI